MKGALTRYRVIAYLVGVGLIVLVLIGVPLEYAAGKPQVVSVIGPIHGFLYIIYVIAALDLSMKLRWPLTRTILICLAGTIPFLSFVAERKVTHEVEQRLSATSAQ